MHRLAITLALLGTLGGGCRATDPACAGRNAADVTQTAAAYERMTIAERRAAQTRLDTLGRLCGWEP